MLLSWYHFFWSFLGALFFGFPSKRIFVLGVTGTKGKSTVLELINAILEAAGKKTALLSSVRIKIDKQGKKNDVGNSMPGRAFIQKFLRQAIKAGCEYALIEVTSQGVLQHRHRFIDWDAALFTNLAPEHIEAHGGFENYRKAKLSFFSYVRKLKASSVKRPAFAKALADKSAGRQASRLFFINRDDSNAQYFIEAAEGQKVILYSEKDASCSMLHALCFMFHENIAAAVAFAKSRGIGEEIIKKAIEDFPGVPGRMEIIQTKPFMAIIDYAHTPDSLEKVYQFIHNSLFIIPNSRLICVLGSAGGGRDKWKRPKMGEIAAKYCEEIILTNEDSYNEPPLEIINQIEEGIRINQPNQHKPRTFYEEKVRGKSAVYKIIDREEAIKKAISLAKPGDIVIITGKGCESWLHLEKGKKIPWNERKIVEEMIKWRQNLTN